MMMVIAEVASICEHQLRANTLLRTLHIPSLFNPINNP